MSELQEVLDDLPSLENKNICIALSGGLDSTTLAYTLAYKYGPERVKAIAFDFGQRHSIELAMGQKTADILGIDFQVIELDYLADIARETSALIEVSKLKPKTAEENAGDPQVNTYVPFRNLQFASITAAFAEAKDCKYIAQGLNETDIYAYWDTSIDFKDAVNNVLNLNRKNQIQFIAPFIELYKVDELRIARELSKIYDYEILKNTWSCYNGCNAEHNYKECGECNTCEEKIAGYILADYSVETIQNKFDISTTVLATKIDIIRGD